ncbi:hypothetical protein E2C01_021063 [Portunus trituberculatus]|uniref:Uncharacterized protein n=1 Tax=Portunus trituberculatus TaxID=210409 RepID=A0A5B7E526_PORTR|nr:hypothetical protein [Portunus trituberculatus]
MLSTRGQGHSSAITSRQQAQLETKKPVPFNFLEFRIAASRSPNLSNLATMVRGREEFISPVQ